MPASLPLEIATTSIPGRGCGLENRDACLYRTAARWAARFRASEKEKGLGESDGASRGLFHYGELPCETRRGRTTAVCLTLVSSGFFFPPLPSPLFFLPFFFRSFQFSAVGIVVLYPPTVRARSLGLMREGARSSVRSIHRHQRGDGLEQQVASVVISVGHHHPSTSPSASLIRTVHSFWCAIRLSACPSVGSFSRPQTAQKTSPSPS